jgi:RNA polymerase sigma-70 factor (ECF subfamily)
MAPSNDLPGPKKEDLTALALRARQGDAGAADRLWAALRPRLSRVALAIGIPPDDVPDLVQDALFAAHRRLESFDPGKGTIEAWLSTSLVRRARNSFRAERRRRRLAERFGVLIRWGARPRPMDAVEARLTLTRLLGALTEGQREVIALYEIGELTAEDTGRLLGITAGGVRSIARDARARLARAALEVRPPLEARR